MSVSVEAALILAGGGAPLELAEVTGQAERALIEINGAPMISYIVDALRKTTGIGRIAVAGSEPVLAAAREGGEIVEVAAGGRMADNLKNGVLALRDGGLASGSILVCTCDIPLIEAVAFEELIGAAKARDLELAYPIVRRAVCEASFPGGRRTYAKLREGEFTGGNAVVLPSRIMDDIIVLVDTAYNARKNPAGLARMLGASLVWKFATKRLSVADVERRAGKVLRCRAGAVEMQNAAIAFDVDKVSDLKVVQQKLEKVNAD